MVDKKYNFFVDYETLKCNNQEFEILKSYIHQDGWTWFGEKMTLLENKPPNNLAAIGFRDRDDKTLIPYFSDEIEYLDCDKQAKDLIIDIRNNKLNKLGI